MWLFSGRNKDDKENGNLTIEAILNNCLAGLNHPDNSTSKQASKQALKDLKKLIKPWRKTKSSSRAGRAASRQMAVLQEYLQEAFTQAFADETDKKPLLIIGENDRVQAAAAIVDLYTLGYIQTATKRGDSDSAVIDLFSNPDRETKKKWCERDNTKSENKRYRHIKNIADSQAYHQKRDYKDLKDTLDYFCDHTVKAGLVGRFGFGGGDADIYRLIKRLYLLGLHKYVSELRDILKVDSKKSNSPSEHREKIELFFYNLYELFNNLNKAKNSDSSYLVPDSELRKLKRAIHRAARVYEADVRIMRVRDCHVGVVPGGFLQVNEEIELISPTLTDDDIKHKLQKKAEKDSKTKVFLAYAGNAWVQYTLSPRSDLVQKTFSGEIKKGLEHRDKSLPYLINYENNDWVIYYVNTEGKTKELAFDKDKNLKVIYEKYLKGQTRLDEQSQQKALKAITYWANNTQRHYVYIPYDQKQVGTVAKKSTTKKKRSKWMTAITIAAVVIALLVGIGEALVAVVLSGALLPFMTALLVVGIAALLVNSLLFYVGINEILRTLRHPSILFKDQNGNEISSGKKVGVIVSFLLGFGGGVAYGFLSYFAASSAAIAFAAAVGLTPIGWVVIAFSAVIALTAGVAIFALFAFEMSNFIRKDGYKKLFEFLKENFVRKEGEGKWHYRFRVLFNGFFLTVGILFSVGLAIAAIGFFHDTAMTVLRGSLQAPKTIALVITIIFVDVIAGAAMGFFNSKQLTQFAEDVRKLLRGIKNVAKKSPTLLVKAVVGVCHFFVNNPFKITWHACKRAWRAFAENPFRYKRHAAVLPVLAAVAVGSVINGVAYGQGVVHDGGANAVAKTGLPPKVAAGFTRVVATIGSSRPNITFSTGLIKEALVANVSSEVTTKSGDKVVLKNEAKPKDTTELAEKAGADAKALQKAISDITFFPFHDARVVKQGEYDYETPGEAFAADFAKKSS